MSPDRQRRGTGPGSNTLGSRAAAAAHPGSGQPLDWWGRLSTDPYYRVTALVLAVLLFYPPYFRGLFFPQEQLWTLIIAAAVFLLAWQWKFRCQDLSFVSRPLDYAALGFLGAYILAALFSPADQRLAVNGALKATLYFFTFWLVSQVSGDRSGRRVIVASLYLSATGVALAGALTALGVIYIKDGFVGSRIFSTLQYPNTLAIYLVAVSFLGFYLWQEAAGDRREPGLVIPWRLALAAGNYLLLFGFLGANSRGAFLVFPAVLLIYFLLLPAERRAGCFTHLVFSAVAAVAGAYRFTSLAAARNLDAAWGYLFLGLTLALGFQLVWDLFAGLLARRAGRLPGRASAGRTGRQEQGRRFPGASGGWPAWGALIITGLIALALVDLVFGGQAGYLARLLPPEVATRLARVNLAEHNVQARFYWAGQALELVRQYPVLGLGGGGWEAAYRSIQNYGYSSTQVHNDWVQLWVESGTVGLAFWLAAWFFFLLTAWRNYREARTVSDRALQVGLLSMGVALAGHAFIDFDLALSAVTMVLWSAIGLTRGLEKERLAVGLAGTGSGLEPGCQDPAAGDKDGTARSGRPPARSQRRRYASGSPGQSCQTRRTLTGMAVLLAALVPIILAGMLLGGEARARQAVKAAQAGQAAAAEAFFRQASRLDPFQATYLADLSRLAAARRSFPEAETNLNKALSLAPYDWRLRQVAAGVYWDMGSLERAVAAMEEANRLYPWGAPTYDSLSRIYVAAGTAYLQRGDRTAAREVLAKAFRLPEKIENRLAALGPKERELWRGDGQFLKLSPAVQLAAGVGGYFLGEYSRAEEDLKTAARAPKDSAQKSEVLLWLAVLAAHQGREGEAVHYLEEAAPARDELLESRYESLLTLPSPL